jgi:hypothetical protein
MAIIHSDDSTTRLRLVLEFSSSWIIAIDECTIRRLIHKEIFNVSVLLLVMQKFHYWRVRTDAKSRLYNTN